MAQSLVSRGRITVVVELLAIEQHCELLCVPNLNGKETAGTQYLSNLSFREKGAVAMAIRSLRYTLQVALKLIWINVSLDTSPTTCSSCHFESFMYYINPYSYNPLFLNFLTIVRQHYGVFTSQRADNLFALRAWSWNLISDIDSSFFFFYLYFRFAGLQILSIFCFKYFILITKITI